MKINVNNAVLAVTAGAAKQFPSDRLPQIAFSGRSNVGKSSLVNSLLNRKNFARVSSAPGKTITINFYQIDKKMYIADLPGYGYAKRSQENKKSWSSLTDGYFTNNKNIDTVCLVVQLVDSRIGPTEDDYAMIDYMKQTGLPFVIVATKCDKLNVSEEKASLAALREDTELSEATDIIMYSAQSGKGKNELWKCIFDALDNN